VKRRTASLLLALVALVASCTAETEVASSPPVVRPTSTTFGHGDTTWRLVALGDSIPLGVECAGCTTFVDLYAKALARSAGVKVDRTDWSIRGFTTARLLDLVGHDAALRSDLAHADVVTLTIGVNDMPWNPGADRCGARSAPGDVDWTRITPACLRSTSARYGELLSALLGSIDALRAGRPTMLRLTGFYDEWIGRDGVTPDELAIVARGIRLFDRAQRRAAEAHGGLVADLLHVLNGPTGTADAGPYLEPSHGVHPNQRGHGLIADTLLGLGLAPLQP
jgi:lysophospholipase L1-like esterase